MLEGVMVVCKLIAGFALFGATGYGAYREISGRLRGTSTPNFRFWGILALMLFAYSRL